MSLPTCVINATPTDKYATLFESGYTVIPITVPGAKFPPAKGCTGNADELTEAEAHALWSKAEPGSNAAIRCQSVGDTGFELLIIDIDNDDNKSGYSGFMEFCHGAGLSQGEATRLLNSTVRVTKHDPANPHGHYYFLVPAGKSWQRSAGVSVDVVQKTHRYALAPGSVVDGNQYRAYDGMSTTPATLPPVHTLPILPDKLQDKLLRGPSSASATAARRSYSRYDGPAMDELTRWLDSHCYGADAALSDELVNEVATRCEHLRTMSPGGRHDEICSGAYALVCLAVTEGCSGIGTALEAYGLAIAAAYADDQPERIDAEQGQIWEAIDKVRAEVEAGTRSCARMRFGGDSMTAHGVTDEQLAALRAALARLRGVPGPGPAPGRIETNTNTNTNKQNGLRLVGMDTIETELPAWLWSLNGAGAIPVGGVTIVTGKGGDGKSSFCRWLAAQITLGTLEGELNGTPHNILYIAAEESVKHVVKPSFVVAGADMRRVKFIEKDNESNNFDAATDMDELINLCLAEDVRAVFVDPITNFFGAKDSHKSSETREALRPWSKLAEAIDGAVIAIAHQNKGAGGDTVAGVGGSAAMTEVARSVLATALDKDTGERVISQSKNNLGGFMPSYSFELIERSYTVESKDGATGTAVAFRLGGRSELTADEIQLKNRQTASGERQTAKSFVRELLAERGELSRSEIIKLASGNYSPRAIDQARKSLGLAVSRNGRESVWRLP